MQARMKGWVPWLVLAALALAPSVVSAQSKVGVFDPQRVFEGSEIGKRVHAQLTSFRDSKQSEIAAMEGQVSDLRKQLRDQELSLDQLKSFSVSYSRRSACRVE